MSYKDIVGEDKWLDLALFVDIFLKDVILADGFVEDSEMDLLNQIETNFSPSSPILAELMKYLKENKPLIFARSSQLSKSDLYSFNYFQSELEDIFQKLKKAAGSKAIKNFKIELISFAMAFYFSYSENYLMNFFLNIEEERVIERYCEILKISMEEVENFFYNQYN